MTKKSILIVEDDFEIAEIYKMALDSDLYKSNLANNGQEALEMIEEEKPDLIVLDLMMPVMDGLEFLKIFRANKDNDDIPVMVLTAKTGELDLIKVSQLGAQDYIVKPVELEIFLTKVELLLTKMD